MILKELTFPILALVVFAITTVLFLFAIRGYVRHFDTCEVCKNTIGNNPSKVAPNDWIAENDGGGTLCTTNLGISSRLDRIEKSLDALDSDMNEIKSTDYGRLLELYHEQTRSIDRNGHLIEAVLNRLERFESRTPPSH